MQARRNKPERRKAERRIPSKPRRAQLLERRAYPPLGLPARRPTEAEGAALTALD